MHGRISKSVLLVSTALLTVSAAAFAANDSLDERLVRQEQEIEALKKQVQGLTEALGKLSAASSAVQAQAAAQAGSSEPSTSPAKVSIDGGRPTLTSADGQFSATLHSLLQYDMAEYHQSKAPAGVQLSNGTNFRRAQVGVAGTAFGDWSYNVTLDFGGSGTEKSGYIYYAYGEYDGLRPFALRIGASTPFLAIDDSTGSGDLLFLERAAAVDVARNIAGGPSRDAIVAFAQGDRYLASLSFTGGKVGDAAVFGEQQAFVGRASYLAYANGDTKLLLGGGGTYVLKVPGTVAGPNPPTSISLSDTPELTVDSTATKLVATPNFDASHISQWQVEGAGTWNSLFAQGGYFGFDVQRRASALADPSFAGWYAQASWTITGETRPYDPTTASFRNPRPSKSVGNGGFGAWEIAARYSSLDLNYDSGALGAALAANGVRGGQQNIWTLGLNWFPNTVFHFALNYEFINVNRLTATGTDAGFKGNAVALRSQLSF